MRTGEYIDINELPEEYGGKGPKADFKYDVDEYLAHDFYLDTIQEDRKLYS